jgi:enoyl-CoA hydratase
MTMTTFNNFELGEESGIATIKLNNIGQKNAMNRAFFHDFPQAIKSLAASAKTRVLVICAEGEHFSSGIDLALLADKELLDCGTPSRREQFKRLVLELQECCSILQKVDFPVLVACQGAVLGAAVDLVSACDLRYASASAYFVIQEINVGLMADLGSLQRLPGQLPEGVLRELAFCGNKLGAERAERLGFVSSVEADLEKLHHKVQEVASVIAARSPLAVAATKQALNYNRNNSVDAALQHAALLQAAVFDHDAVMASIEAMKNKTVPQYQNLLPEPILKASD